MPLLSPIVFSTAVRATGRPFTTAEFSYGFFSHAGIAWACLVMLWGSGTSRQRPSRHETSWFVRRRRKCQTGCSLGSPGRWDRRF
jgi:hypothetical protein